MFMESFLALVIFLISVWSVSKLRNYLKCYLIANQIRVTFCDSSFENGELHYTERNTNNLVNTVGEVITALVQFVGWDTYVMSSKELACDINNINISIRLISQTEFDLGPTEIKKSLLTPGDINKLKVEFSVKKTGVYNLTVHYMSFCVPHSSFMLKFNSGPLDPLQSALISHSPTLLCYKTQRKTTGIFEQSSSVSNIFVIETLDRYGNISCNADLRKLSFVIHEIKKTESITQHSVPQLDYNYQAEFLTNPRNKDVKLVIKVYFYKAGIYRGEISYDNILFHNGELNVIVIEGKEQQLILRVLERGFPLPELEAHLYCSATYFINVRIIFHEKTIQINDINVDTGRWTKTISSFKITSLKIGIMTFDETLGKCQLQFQDATTEASKSYRVAMSPLKGKLFIVLLSNVQLALARDRNACQNPYRFETSTSLHQNVFL